LGGLGFWNLAGCDTNCTNSHELRNERGFLIGEVFQLVVSAWKFIASWKPGDLMKFVLIRPIRVKIFEFLSQSIASMLLAILSITAAGQD
jgi:hypothetical protein